MINQNTNKKQIIVKRRNQKEVEKPKRSRKPKIKSPIGFANQTNDMLRFGLGKTLGLAPAVRNFSRIYMYPFTLSSARLPVFPITRSQLVVTHAKGSGVTNVNNIGWVIASPSNGITNNLNTVVYTDQSGGASPNNISPPYGGGTGLGTSFTNSPYQKYPFVFDNVDGNENVFQMRIVATGLRIRSTGTNLNRGGIFRMGNNPNRLNQPENVTISTLNSWPQYKEHSAGFEWVGIHREIDSQQDFLMQALYSEGDSEYWAYNNDSTMLSLDSSYNMTIFYQSAAPTQPFEWEFYAHYELYGLNLQNTGSVMPKTEQVQTVVSGKKITDSQSTSSPMLVEPKKQESFLGNLGKMAGEIAISGILGGL